MRVIIGYGNTLRGEDGFGVEVIEKLQNYNLADTKLISAFQLTPELCLELLEAQEIIFVDATYGKNRYSLASDITQTSNTNLSHHITPKVIVSILKDVYSLEFNYMIYSMVTDCFDNIGNSIKYQECIDATVGYIVNGTDME